MFNSRPSASCPEPWCLSSQLILGHLSAERSKREKETILGGSGTESRMTYRVDTCDTSGPTHLVTDIGIRKSLRCDILPTNTERSRREHERITGDRKPNLKKTTELCVGTDACDISGPIHIGIGKPLRYSTRRNGTLQKQKRRSDTESIIVRGLL